jgi:hypothetical protein
VGDAGPAGAVPGFERRRLDLGPAAPRERGHPGVGLDAEHAAAGRLELPGCDAGAAADVQDVRSRAGGHDPFHQGTGVGRPGAVVASGVLAERLGYLPVLVEFRGRRGRPGLEGSSGMQPPYRPCSTYATLCAMILGMATTGELISSAVEARRVARNAIALAVREARAEGWSWDKISAALGGTPNGETLRRNFGGENGTAP